MKNDYSSFVNFWTLGISIIGAIVIGKLFFYGDPSKNSGFISQDNNHEIIFVSETKGYLKTNQPANIPNEEITFTFEKLGKYTINTARLGMPLEFVPTMSGNSTYQCFRCPSARLDGIWFLKSKTSQEN